MCIVLTLQPVLNKKQLMVVIKTGGQSCLYLIISLSKLV